MSFKISQTFNKKRKFGEMIGAGNVSKNTSTEDELVLLIDEDTGEITEQLVSSVNKPILDTKSDSKVESKTPQPTKSNPKVLCLSMKKISSDSFM